MKRTTLAATAAICGVGLLVACGSSSDKTSGGGGNGGSDVGGAGAGDSGAGHPSTSHGSGGTPAQGGGGSGAMSGPAANVSSSASGGGAGGSGPCTVSSASGKIYYVDQGAPGASDSNPGTKASPWKTIQNAGNVVGAGDTVVVEPGTYGGVIFGWDPPGHGSYSKIVGSAAKRITFEADPTAAAGSVIINSQNGHTQVAIDLEPGCDYVDWVGFTVKNDGTVTKSGVKVAGSTGNRVLNLTVDGVGGIGGILVDGVSQVLVQGNTILHTQGTGTTGHGLYISGSSDQVSVLFNDIHDNDFVGIHVNGDISEPGIGVVTHATIGGNLIHKNGQNGINCDGIENSVFVNNVIYDNDRNGIELYQIDALGGSTGNVIVNNSIDQSAHGYAIEVAACEYDNQGSAPTPAGCKTSPADTSTGNIAFNNVLFGASGPTSTVTGADLSTSKNLTTMSPSPFVNSAGGNYKLVAGGPGAGAGVASFGGADAPTDGGAHDIGAFDFGLVTLCP